MAIFPFEATEQELQAEPEIFVAAVRRLLESEFLVLPRGDGFVDFPTFDRGYEELKKATGGFSSMSPQAINRTVLSAPIVLLVLRSMLGFTPPEWA